MSNNQSNIYNNSSISDFIILNLKDLASYNINASHKVKRNSIIYVTGGSSILQIDFDDYIALENRIFFIDKYKIWNFSKINKLKGIMVQFTDSFYNHIYTGNPKLKSDQTLIGEIPPFVKLMTSEKNEWENLMNIMSYEYLSAKKNSKEVICLILKALIVIYRRESQAEGKIFESHQKKQYINEFRKLVNNRFYTLRTARDYAHELNITPNYLNALCQEYFFKSVTEIIQERIILEAKRLLIHTSMSVAEICYKLGFQDTSYFGRYFKKVVGMTPKNFRSISQSSFISLPGDILRDDNKN